MAWTRVTYADPCPICRKSDWCRRDAEAGQAICNRVESPLKCEDRGGGWYHPDFQATYSGPPKKPEVPEFVQKRYLDNAYRTLLNSTAYASTPTALEYLQKRRVNPTPALIRHSSFIALSGIKYEEIKNVPGFYSSDGVEVELVYHNDTLLIPYKSLDGFICGIQLRSLVSKKYFWLSSGYKPNGTNATVRLHWAFPKEVKDYREVWITEGAIKAESVAQNLGKICVGVPGIGAVHAAISELKKELPNQYHKIVVALDQDGNPLTDTAREILFTRKSVPGDTYLAEWSGGHKGIDDAIGADEEINLIQVV